MFYIIKRTFRNLKDWLPVIIKDEHFEEEYLFKILQRKLELKEKFFRGDNAMTECAEQTADEIKAVKEALERVIKDSYLEWKDNSELTREFFDKEDQLKNKDLDFIFNEMRQKHNNWWD